MIHLVAELLQIAWRGTELIGAWAILLVIGIILFGSNKAKR